MSVNVIVQLVRPRARKLTSTWSPEAAHDFVAYHGATKSAVTALIYSKMVAAERITVEPVETRFSRRLASGDVLYFGPARFLSWSNDSIAIRELHETKPIVYLDAIRVRVFDNATTMLPSLVVTLYRVLLQGRLIAIADRPRFKC